MTRHKYRGKWSEFDYDEEKAQTFLKCQKQGQLVFRLRREDPKMPGGLCGQHSFSKYCPPLKPFWTLEDIAYQDEGHPINIIDSEGIHWSCEYSELTTDWRFALDYASSREYTLDLPIHPQIPEFQQED